jgi:hypothetical protein
MLNLNKPIEPSPSAVSSGKAPTTLKVPAAAGPPIWKILVLDQETKDILATVLRVQDLRDIGVTLHVYPLFSAVRLHCLSNDDSFQPTSLISATSPGRPSCLLRLSDPGKYQENCRRPWQGPL